MKALLHTVEISGTFSSPPASSMTKPNLKKYPSADVIPEKA
jgi:hypothetical protein